MIFQYEADKSIKFMPNVELDFIFSYLESMDPKDRSFCMLASNDRSYVQCSGSKIRLIIECRKYNQTGFNHFILGKSQEEPKNSSINYSGGIIRLQCNEVLSADDAKAVFLAFYETNEILPGYHLRNITKTFFRNSQ